MDNIIMPELITPEFAKVIAENPEVLKMIVDHKPNEKVIVRKDCKLDCSDNPTNVKLVFCNVTIGIDDRGCGTGKTEEQIGNCHIKIGGREQKHGDKYCGSLSNAQSQLALEVAVLEAKKEAIEKILRLIPRQVINRKLVARCKKEISEAEVKLADKKKKLEYIKWLIEYGNS